MTEKDLIDVPADVSPEQFDTTEVPALFRGADEGYVTALEKTAANAPRVITAMQKILVAVAHDGDWVVQDGKAGLCSAGAERYLKFFPMRFVNWSSEKQEWTDKEGPAYRWVYRCTAEFNGSCTQVEGRFSTRDKFLGFRNQQWRPLEEIDESDIRAAAMHVCRGEGIKVMLGLRAIPEGALRKLGVPLKDARRIEHTRGADGGAPAATGDDATLQKRLRMMLLDMSNGDTAEASKLLESTTGFTGKDGKEVPGRKRVEQLTGKWLGTTYGKIKDQYISLIGQAEYDARIEGGGNGAPAV